MKFLIFVLICIFGWILAISWGSNQACKLINSQFKIVEEAFNGIRY